MDNECEKNLIYIKIGNTVLAFGPPRKINFHTTRDVAMHAHSVFELHSLYDGEANIETEHSSHVFRAGNIALIPPNVYHSVTNVTDSFALRSFSFSLYDAEERQADTRYDGSRLFQFIQYDDVIIMEGLSTIMWVVEHLCNEVNNQTLPGTNYLQEAYSTALLVMLLRKFLSIQQFSVLPSSPPKPVSSFIDPVRATQIEMYFAENYVDGNIGQLARTLSLSEQHVRRILLSHYGMPFLQIINKHRTNVSKQLLRETDLPITEIWRSVGFNTPQSFNNAFRKYAECTPSQYRKKQRSNPQHNRQYLPKSSMLYKGYSLGSGE